MIIDPFRTYKSSEGEEHFMGCVHVEELKPGQVLESNVYMSHGRLLLPEKTILTDKQIKKLMDIGIQNVDIRKEKETIEFIPLKKNNIDKELETQYRHCINKSKSMMAKLQNGMKPGQDELHQVVRDIMGKIIKKTGVMDAMLELGSKDDYFYKHSINVAILSNLTARWLGYDKKEQLLITVSGFLHDVGMVKVPQHIVDKKFSFNLSDEEFSELKKHTKYGAKICGDVLKLPKNVCDAVMYHHEQEDGQGYPHGITSDKISEYAKIISVCNTFEKLIADESGQSCTPYEAVVKIREMGFNTLCPNIAYTFSKKICDLFVGNIVYLSNGKVGEVIYINDEYPTKPVVKIDDRVCYNLYEMNNIHILKHM